MPVRRIQAFCICKKIPAETAGWVSLDGDLEVEYDSLTSCPIAVFFLETSNPNIQTASLQPASGFQSKVTDRLADFPWWVLFILLAGVFLTFNFATNETYNTIIRDVGRGLQLTILVTLVAYFFALILGLSTALGQISKNLIFRNIAMFYVQVVRGVPIIVQIFYVALVIIPIIAIPAINWLGETLASTGIVSAENALATLTNRDVSFTVRGVAALAFSYGAFSSEIFRAGIQSIGRGQVEAARSLGLTPFQSFRLVIFPQAVRRILPPLGNDFIAMLKESSLVSVLGVQEITQLGRKYAAASFKFAQTYNTLAFLYLSMTLVLSMGVKFMERRLRSAG
jgi:polar amino acid transport system permease protein